MSNEINVEGRRYRVVYDGSRGQSLNPTPRGPLWGVPCYPGCSCAVGRIRIAPSDNAYVGAGGVLHPHQEIDAMGHEMVEGVFWAHASESFVARTYAESQRDDYDPRAWLRGSLRR